MQPKRKVEFILHFVFKNQPQTFNQYQDIKCFQRIHSSFFFPITITTEGRSHAGSSVVQETFPPFDNKVNIQRHQGFMQAEASKKQEGKATFPRLCNKAQNNIWVSWVLVESTSHWVSNGLSLQTQVWLIILLFLQSKMLCLFYCLFWVL